MKSFYIFFFYLILLCQNIFAKQEKQASVSSPTCPVERANYGQCNRCSNPLIVYQNFFSEEESSMFPQLTSHNYANLTSPEDWIAKQLLYFNDNASGLRAIKEFLQKIGNDPQVSELASDYIFALIARVKTLVREKLTTDEIRLHKILLKTEGTEFCHKERIPEDHRNNYIENFHVDAFFNHQWPEEVVEFRTIMTLKNLSNEGTNFSGLDLDPDTVYETSDGFDDGILRRNGVHINIYNRDALIDGGLITTKVGDLALFTGLTVHKTPDAFCRFTLLMDWRYDPLFLRDDK